MRAAVAHRDTKTLGIPDNDISSPFAGRLQDRQAQEISGHNCVRTLLVYLFDKLPVVMNRAVRAGILQKGTEDRLVEFEFFMVPNNEFDSMRLRAGAHDFDGLRMTGIGHKKCLTLWAILNCKTHG